MNTRFKFRIWDKEEKEYLQEGALIDSRTGFIVGYLDADCFIVEQCTGLKDKNGKFIYEGDVLEFDIGVHPVCVQWGSNKCRFVLQRFDINGWETSLIPDTASSYTIIGNIHEDHYRNATKKESAVKE